MVTTIQLDERIKAKLDHLKVHHRETYNELLARLIANASPKNMAKESLVETIEVLSDPETMRDIAEAMENISKGNLGKPLSQIKKEMGIKYVRTISSASS